MYIIHHQFLTVLLFLQVSITVQKNIILHYPHRVSREDEDNDSHCTVLGVLGQIFSLVIFVFYLLIILGLIKACLGLCCSQLIGEIGLELIMDDYSSRKYNRSTEFCMNMVFFLVLPFGLFRHICRTNQTCSVCSSRQNISKFGCACSRKTAGAEKDIKKPEQKISLTVIPKKKKGFMDVYLDGNDSETQDTKYVLEQLHRSEQSLRGGVIN